ncbi:hypothetical protein SARC_00027 [Sphaeroforma arctica JP610]|uniref:Uncharacterized protein n=1 Tax=Sphaeroforma arctica JP610 TaxID=667725 RepID=A0A0L0GFM5_9EUKA|nr:hypothetical protein SARC_00027 [Sphaeroforma arctica JP610]KNC87895.1 hypothetical protein SARC_00027 [Sphaeroforma arctica JP610]|eukprot:XP_014161797.1 hypothetical protein SARC_00027 [Sphaeroforma arctica JP610]
MMAWDNPKDYAQIHCPRKPKQCENEWKTIVCCAANIIFHVDLCEAKVRPEYLPALKYTDQLSTVSIVMRLTDGIRGTDPKKRGSWPKGVPGDKIKDLMATNPLFSVGTLQGAFNYNKDAVQGQILLPNIDMSTGQWVFGLSKEWS